MSQYIAKHKIKGDSETENDFLITQVMLSYLKNHPNCGIKEVEHAFDMYEANKLTFNDEAFIFYPIFNVGHCLKVMTAYQQYKAKELELEARSQKLFEEPNKPKPTQEETRQARIELIKKTWDLANENKYNNISGHYVWELMKFLGIADTDLDWESIEKDAARNLESTVDRQLKRESYSIALRNIENQGESQFRIECKRVASAYQCKRWIEKGLNFDDITKMII